MKLSRYKHSSPLSYAFGATLCFELLKTKPAGITRIFLRQNLPRQGDDLQRILAAAKEENIEIIESTKAFNILGAKDSCLLIAEFTKTSSSLAPQAPHLVLVNPSDAGNLGTIMRSAAAFNYCDIAIIDPAVDHFDPKAIRSSMGAVFHLNIEHFSSFDAYLEKYPRSQKYAFMLDKNAQPAENFIKEASASKSYALILGNEAAGLPKDFASRYNCQPVILRQSPLVDSLNLSIASSIAMYLFKKD